MEKLLNIDRCTQCYHLNTDVSVYGGYFKCKLLNDLSIRKEDACSEIHSMCPLADSKALHFVHTTTSVNTRS